MGGSDKDMTLYMPADAGNIRFGWQTLEDMVAE
jgi:hypothetical protein